MRNNKKVCFVIFSLRSGGAERIVSRLANELIHDHHVGIILLSSDESFYELDDRITVSKFHLSKQKVNTFTYYLQLYKYIRSTVKQISPGVVISFGEKINSFVLFSLMFLKIKKYVANRASPLSAKIRSWGKINPVFYPLADGIIVQTTQAVKLSKGLYPFSRFTVIPNPIEVPKRTTPILQRDKIILNVGLIGGRKNQDQLIDYFIGIDPPNEWKLIFAGDGDNRTNLENRVSKSGFSDRILFLGNRKDVPELLDNAQIFAFTSSSEGFPNALAEALAHGCACISYDCPTGPSDLIKDRVNGFLIELNNKKMYKERLKKMIEDDSLKEKFSLNSRRDIEPFEKSRIIDDFIELINS